MPKLPCHILLIFLALVFTTACRQDFRLTADYQETTIAVGLLSMQDSNHYIRVQRGFIDSAKSAIQIAKDPDSIYYNDLLEIRLIDLDKNVTHQLERVDGNEIGIVKDSGFFAQSPNILYRLNQKLNDSARYRLQVYHPDMPDTLQAETNLVGKVKIQLPSEQYVVNWIGDFHENVNFSWRHEGEVGIYDLAITFWYTEKAMNGTKTVKNERWKIFTNKLTLNERPGALIGHNYRTMLFFQNIGGRIPLDTTVTRSADSVSFVMAAGGIELAKLISNQKVRNGLLSGMALPYYTNIENGYGIFSSVYRDTVTNSIGPATRDSLRWGQFTRQLNFQ